MGLLSLLLGHEAALTILRANLFALCESVETLATDKKGARENSKWAG